MKKIIVGVAAIASGTAVLALAHARSPIIAYQYLPEDQNIPQECMIYIGVRTKDQLQVKGSCSGTLIDHSWILTASHCVNEGLQNEGFGVSCPGGAYEPGKTFRVWASPVDNPLGGVTEQIKPQYPRIDLALLKLEKPIPTQPIAFPESDQDLTDLLHKNCRITGYGIDNSNQVGAQHTAQTSIFAFDRQGTTDTRGDLTSLFPYDLRGVAAFGFNASIASGDSGGALYCFRDDGTAVLTAVHSNTIGMLSVSALVKADIVQWIRSFIASNGDVRSSSVIEAAKQLISDRIEPDSATVLKSCESSLKSQIASRETSATPLAQKRDLLKLVLQVEAHAPQTRDELLSETQAYDSCYQFLSKVSHDSKLPKS